MEGVGSEVIIALAIPFVAMTSIFLYYRNQIGDYLKYQFSNDVRIEENEY